MSACGMLMNQVARVRHFGHHFEGGSIVAIIKITSFTWHTHVSACPPAPSLSCSTWLCGVGVFWFCGFVVDVFLVYYLALRMRPTPAPWALQLFGLAKLSDHSPNALKWALDLVKNRTCLFDFFFAFVLVLFLLLSILSFWHFVWWNMIEFVRCVAWELRLHGFKAGYS